MKMLQPLFSTSSHFPVPWKMHLRLTHLPTRILPTPLPADILMIICNWDKSGQLNRKEGCLSSGTMFNWQGFADCYHMTITPTRWRQEPETTRKLVNNKRIKQAKYLWSFFIEVTAVTSKYQRASLNIFRWQRIKQGLQTGTSKSPPANQHHKLHF